MLRELDFEDLVSKAGGLDGEPGWATSLSLDEQQLLPFARAILAAPQFVFLDRVDTTIGPQQLRKILLLLSGHSITCVNNGEAHDTRNLYQAVVQINEDGAWTKTANPA